MYGQKQKAPRWKDCTSHIMERLERMQYATSATYISKIFDQESKNVTLEMIDDLQEVFREILSNNDWMDDQTKATALGKANQMLRQIAYPDFILNDQELDEYYRGLNVHDTDSYSEMLEKVARWGIEYSFERLTIPVDRSEYNFNSAIVDAYYSPTSNSIRRQFDANGSLREWWDEGVKKNFENRAQCTINQYGNIEVPGIGLKINGKLTQGENIADNGGVKQAYRAYKAYLEKHGGEEERIKGMEQYNNEQMFFLGYATVALTRRSGMTHSPTLDVVRTFDNDELINRVLTDPHAPQRYRVNQVLANQPEFAAAFRCEEGSAMNPLERCAVW